MKLRPFPATAAWTVSALAVMTLATACGGELDELDEPERIGTVTSALTVEEAVNAGCSTVQLEALSLQIIAQGNCNVPAAFATLPNVSNVNLGGAVLPYLEEPARDALVAALEANPSESMQINSMLRTVAQQYLLYRWWQLQKCGIGLAASPSNSNHETGLAIDIQQYNTWKPILEANGFDWLGPSDPVHFDYVGPGAVNHLGLDVLAFQQLWNLNQPEDIIAEDGDYGPQTENRLKQAPSEGFLVGPNCSGVGFPVVPPPGGVVAVSARILGAGDPLDDGPSAGISDMFVGRGYSLQVDLHNPLVAVASDVVVDINLPPELLQGHGYQLSRNGDGDFKPMVVPPGNPNAAATLPETFQLALGTVNGGEILRIEIAMAATGYSLTQAEPAQLSVVADASQLTLPFDVYDERRYEWDGGRLEGWEKVPISDTTVLASLSEEQLELRAEGPDLAAQRNGLGLALGSVQQIAFRGRRSGGDSTAFLFVAADGEEVVGQGFAIEVDWPADGEMHEVVVPEADLQLVGQELTGIALVAFSGENGPLSADIDYLRIGVAPEARVPGANPDCACELAAGGGRALGLWGLVGILGVGLLGWRRSR